MLSRSCDDLEATAKKRREARAKWFETFGEEPNARWGHVKIASEMAKRLKD